MKLTDIWCEVKKAEDHYKRSGKEKVVSALAQASLMLRVACEIDAGVGENLLGVQTDTRTYAGTKK